MGTIPSVQLFRNSNIITGRQAAIDALEAQKAKVADGGLILARYSEDGRENGVKTLLGIVRNGGGTNVQLTVIDVEGAAQNVQSAITSAINKLNKGDAAVDGLYVDSVSEDKGIITVTRRPLPSFNRLSFKGQAVTAITQTNGQVSVEFGGIDAYNVSVTDVHGRFESDNVGGALYEIQDSLSEAMRNVAMQIGTLSTSSKVTLDTAEGSEGSNVLKVYTIKQGDREVGTINIPKDLVVTSGSVVKGNWNDGVFTEDVSGSGTALKLVIANQTNPVYINTLDLVKDHIAGNGIAISDTNEISVKRDTASENFLTVGADGVKLDGVQNAISAASGHVNTIIDARLGTGVTSESTATDQFAALSGQITSINATIDSLDATVTGGSTHVDVTVGQANGIITSVTVANNDIASATDLTNEITNRTNAIKGISGDTTIDNGKVITAISQRNGIVSVTAATLGAENVSASTITDDGTKVAVTGDNVKAQIESLAKSIKSASTAAAAAHTKVEAKTDGHVIVSVAKSSDGSHDVVTIAENDIASATALTAETDARVAQDNKIEAAVGLNEDGTHAHTTGNYTNGATTVVGEIAALDTKLKEVSDTLGTGVTTAATVTAQLQALSGTTGDASGVTSVEGAKAYAKDLVDNLDAEVESETNITTTKAIKIVQTNGKIASITLGAFDCGTY